MTAKHFKNDKTKKNSATGKEATHWTNENMEFCTSISGTFKTNPIDAAKEHFAKTHYCADEGATDYVDGEDLLMLEEINIDVYGLIKESDGQYYWTGKIKTVTFNTTAIIND